MSREELIKAVWLETNISDSTLDASIWEARRAVGDSGKTQQIIRNVHGRGYSFIFTPVHVEEESAAALQGNLALRIWEPGNPGRQGLSLEARGVLPLQPRDRVRLAAEVNKAAYLYLIWIDSEGKPIPLFPWRPVIGRIAPYANNP